MIETFAVVLEADTRRRAGEQAQDRRDAGEQLEVDHGVDALLAAEAQEREDVARHVQERVVAQREDVALVEEAQEPETRRVLAEDREGVLRVRIALLHAADGGRGDDRAAHLRELDEQDTARRAGGPRLAEEAREPHQERQHDVAGTPTK